MVAILEGRDALVALPTGFGKSLIYQVPAMILDRPTIVISPLIALMADQERARKSRGIPVVVLHSVSKRPRPRSRSLPPKRTRCQYRHHLRAAASIIASTAPFTASSSIGSTSASSYAIACKNCERSPGRSSAAARRTDANCVSVK